MAQNSIFFIVSAVFLVSSCFLVPVYSQDTQETKPVTEPGFDPITTQAPEVSAEPIATPVLISAPIAEPVSAPVGEPVAVPISAPVEEPVAVPISAPVGEPVAVPISAPVEEPIIIPISAPVKDSTAGGSSPDPAQKCGANEKYTNCGTSCPDTCDNYDTPRICTRQCVQGCFCEQGYVRNRKNQCVLKKNCPKVFKCQPRLPFEIQPQPGKSCSKTCGSIACSPIKGGSCICANNYVRDSNGQCVPINKCPVGCGGKNEIYDSRKTKDATCSSLNKKSVAAATATEGCFCKQGYARNNAGVCVSLKECRKCVK